MMNLGQTLQQLELEAGGPGSGRKPSFDAKSKNKGALQEMHDSLVKKGFQYKKSEPYNGIDSRSQTHYYENGKGARAGIEEKPSTGKHRVW